MRAGMSIGRRLQRQRARVPRGSIRCEKHGVQPLVRVCEHAHEGLGAARLHGGPREGRYLLCPDCAKNDLHDHETCQKCVEEDLGLSVDEEAS